MPRYSQWERGRPPRAPIPSPPGPGDYISQHRSLRPRDGKKKKKKVWAKHSRNALPAHAERGAGGEARVGRGGRGGRGAAWPEPGRALGPAQAPAWPSRCSGKPSPACGAGRNFPGKSRTRRSAVSRGGGRGGGAEPRPAREMVPEPQGGTAGGRGGAPRSPPRPRVGDREWAGVLSGRGWEGGERGYGPLRAPGPGCQRCGLLARPGRGPRP